MNSRSLSRKRECLRDVTPTLIFWLPRGLTRPLVKSHPTELTRTHTQRHSQNTHTQTQTQTPICKPGGFGVTIATSVQRLRLSRLIRETVRDSGVRQTWIEVHALLLTSCATWSNILTLAEPRFLGCQMRMKTSLSWNNVLVCSTGLADITAQDSWCLPSVVP